MIVFGNKLLLLNHPRSCKFHLVDSFGNSKTFRKFEDKIRTINLQKFPKFDLPDNYISNLFTEVQIWCWKTFKFGLGCVFRNINWTPSKKWLSLIIRAVNRDKRSKTNFAENHDQNVFWKFFIFDQIFLSP